MTPDRPIKVSIIGGGCAAITAAFELTDPAQQGRYEVTVYQQGWRLGGKGASGRGESGRIEEHGLHLWMGHYDNAFRLMRDCYTELGRDPRTCPVADWTDAFVPDPYCGLTELGPDGRWHHLMAHFPPFPGTPGDPYPSGVPLTVTDYLGRGTRLLYALLVSAQKVAEKAQSPSANGAPNGAARGSLSVEALVDNVTTLLRYGQLATLTGVIQGVAVLESIFDMLPAFPQDLLRRYLDAISASASKLLEPLLAGDIESRYLWEVIDIVIATLRGSVMFGLTTDPRGFDAINDYDCREWLLLCGASERAVNSSFVRGLYDLAFAYEDGDPDRPSISAGQGLRGGFRMFMAYRTSVFWKMQAGMGDIVFAPFYEVLKRRGVRFEFFHRLENVALAPESEIRPGEKPYVSRLDFDVQARIENGGEFQPLVDYHGLPCWPATPDWSQLVDGERLASEGRDFECFWDRRFEARTTKEVGTDFDFVVLGVGIGSVPYVCKDFLERDSRWRDMVTHLKTVQTQAFQIWMDEDMESLGWYEDPTNISGFVEPFDSWADMTHLVKTENWAKPPKTIAYFCNAMPSGPVPDLAQTSYPREQDDQVKENAIEFLNRDVVHLWERAQDPSGKFRWDTLSVTDDPSNGEARFDTQFWTANVNPSDRYVLCLPGTPRFRISPLDGTYDNFTITGDWTDCGFNFGCVEAAVMSGRLASHALSLYPRLEDIFGYDHP